MEKKKNHVLLIVVIIVLVLGTAGACVFAVFKMGLISGGKSKVWDAAMNTFTERTELEKALQLEQIVKSEQYTLGFEGNLLGNDSTFELSKSPEKLQFTQSTKSSMAFLPDLDLTADLTSEKLEVFVPLLGSQLFTYDYVGDKSGALVDALGSDKVAQMDKNMLAVYKIATLNITDDDTKKTLALLKVAYEMLECDKLDEKAFTIDGQSVSCPGYMFSVNQAELKIVLDVIEKVSKDQTKYQKLREEISHWSEVKVSCYLYDEKLAAVQVDLPSEYHDYELQLHGGTIRMQNFELLQDNEELLARSGKLESDIETTEIRLRGEPCFSVDYNPASGDADFNFLSGVLKGVSSTGKIVKEGNGVSIQLLEGGDGAGASNMTGLIYTKDSANQQALSGEEVDVGQAAEDVYEGVTGMWESIKSIWE